MTEDGSVLLASEAGIAVHRRGDVTDAVGACFGSRGLILTEGELGEDFFVLSTGLAGELMQKFANYGIPLAIVVADFDAHGARFSELAREHARHGTIRILHSVEEARAWLEPGPPIQAELPQLTAEALLAAALDPAWADAPRGAPPGLVVIPGGGVTIGGGELAGVRQWLVSQPIPLVGYGLPAASPLAPVMDVLVDSAADLEQVTRQITARPAASAVLVQVLRSVGSLDTTEALALESLAYGALQGGSEFAAWLAANAPGGRGSARKPRRDTVVRLRSGAELEIRLDCPENRNALSVPMRDQLTDAFRLVMMDAAIQRVHVRGSGPCFSAGGDLTEFGSTRDTAAAHQVRMLRMPARYLAACAERYEFHVHGACIGAGIELAAFAGRITATGDAFFQLPELAMGLIPGAGGCVSIPRRIGRQRTAWLAFTNRRLSAADALSWGLVDAIED